MKLWGGEERAKYGNKLIKEYSLRLTKELGKGYDVSNLKRMRQFYLTINKGGTVCHQLSWSHYRYILPVGNIKIFNYYVMAVKNYNLSVRELRNRIKSNEYERIGLEHFLKELGIGFSFIGHEIKIKIDDNYNYIDFLLFNIKYNCYVVLEIKKDKVTASHIGQTLNYIKYIDKYVKEPFHEKTVGIILCKKEDGFILKYCTNYNIFTTTFELTH